MSFCLAQPARESGALDISHPERSLLIQQTRVENILRPRRDAGAPKVKKVRSQSRGKQAWSHAEQGFLSLMGVVQSEMPVVITRVEGKGQGDRSWPELSALPLGAHEPRWLVQPAVLACDGWATKRKWRKKPIVTSTNIFFSPNIEGVVF